MSTDTQSLIILEDDSAHVQAILRSFRDATPPVEIRVARSLREYCEMVAEQTPDIALLDLNLPDGNNMEALSLLSEENHFPVLVMTSCGNEAVAVTAMKAGALDYLVKSAEVFANMPRAVQRVLREWNLIEAHKKSEALLRESEMLQRDVLNSLPAHIAVLDQEGTILAVNEPWMAFAREEGNPSAEKVGVGANYIAVCRLSRVEGDFYAESALAGLQAVLDGKQERFTLDYPCDAPGVDRWFSMDILRATGTIAAAIVSHTDITLRKRAEDAQRHLEVMTKSNLKLKKEIALRQSIEASLQKTQDEQTRLLEQSHRQQEKLRSMSHQILQVQEEERKRISRELHDVIAQTLVGIDMRVAALTKGVGVDDQCFQQQIEGIHQLVDKSVSSVHQFIRELRPTALDDLGLIPSLQAFITEFVESSGIQVSLQAADAIEQADSSIRTVLYRVAQEALTNVVRHAKATHVKVGLCLQSGNIRLEIADNGQGFDVDDAASWMKGPASLGILGMKERVQMVGGTFSIDSAPGMATTIRVEIAPVF